MDLQDLHVSEEKQEMLQVLVNRHGIPIEVKVTALATTKSYLNFEVRQPKSRLGTASELEMQID